MSKPITKSQMNAMALHDELSVDNFTTILKVPGGWIYKFWNDEKQDWTNFVFVPYLISQWIEDEK